MKQRKWLACSGLAFDDKEDMEILHKYALKGWIFREYRYGFYILHKEEPQNLVFGYDIKKLKKEEEEEYKEIFRSFGWEEIKCDSRNIHFFVSKEGAIPIHTDQQIEVSQFRSGFYLGFILLSLGFIFLAGIIFYKNNHMDFYKVGRNLNDFLYHLVGSISSKERIASILGSISGGLIGAGGMMCLGCGARLLKKRVHIILTFRHCLKQLLLGITCLFIVMIVKSINPSWVIVATLFRLIACVYIPFGVVGVLTRYPYFRDKME